MQNASNIKASPRLVLCAERARDLMTPSPLSLRAGASVREASAFLTEHDCHCAPVVDDTGRPVGVLRRSDLIAHGWDPAEAAEHTRVCDLMTPASLSVSAEAPAAGVIRDMLDEGADYLFVVDRDGVTIGIIRALDVLARLREEGPRGEPHQPLLLPSPSGGEGNKRGARLRGASRRRP